MNPFLNGGGGTTNMPYNQLQKWSAAEPRLEAGGTGCNRIHGCPQHAEGMQE